MKKIGFKLFVLCLFCSLSSLSLQGSDAAQSSLRLTGPTEIGLNGKGTWFVYPSSSNHYTYDWQISPKTGLADYYPTGSTFNVFFTAQEGLYIIRCAITERSTGKVTYLYQDVWVTRNGPAI